MKHLFLIINCIASLAGLCQETAYQPFQKNPAKEKEILAAVEQRYSFDVKSLSGDYKKELSALYKERADAIKERIDKKELLTDNLCSSYLQGVADKIFKANPSLDATALRIYFSRAAWPNAASMGEGTILFNAGLFSRLTNEAQVAFVLCHELAHYILNHGNNAIDRYVTTINSPQFQKQLKQIQKSEYGQNSQIEKLALNLSFKSRKHSREFEKAADSMALILLQPTGYAMEESLTCLALLDSVDKDRYAGKLMLDTKFNFSAYPFKKRWLGSSTLAFTETTNEATAKKELADSLKTHPACTERIYYLQDRVKASGKTGAKKFLVSEATFLQLQKLFAYETLEYDFESDQIAACLFVTLQMLTDDQGNAYLLGLAARCLNKLYTAQKAHTLGKITDLSNKEFDEEYNTFLKFLQNVRLPELAAIWYYYLQANETAGKKNEEFFQSYINSAEAFEKTEERTKLMADYYATFPKHKYSF